jgi:hypothetical protein
MTVEPIGGLEGEESPYAEDHRTHDLVSDVEVIMHESATLGSENAVTGIVGGIFGLGGTKRRSLFHASIDEVDAVSVLALHAPEPWQDVVFFADSFFRPFDLDAMIFGEGFNPVPIVHRALTEDFLGDGWHMQDLTKEIDRLFGPGQAAEVSVDDNAVKAVVLQTQVSCQTSG